MDDEIKEHPFSLCVTEECVKKLECYRYACEPTPKQSACDIEPKRNDPDNFLCDFKIEIPKVVG